uniref:Uncharacterized protein n=1 Tax=Anguilla anguilla TaxID=7936 RepID=A0A0E9RVR7_ANGAN
MIGYGKEPWEEPRLTKVLHYNSNFSHLQIIQIIQIIQNVV